MSSLGARLTSERVLDVIAKSKNIKFLLVLRTLLITSIHDLDFIKVLDNYTCAKSHDFKLRKRIFDENIRILDEDLPEIKDQLVKNDLIFDPEDSYPKYCIKPISDSNENLVDQCDKKIDELLPNPTTDNFVLIDESGKEDGGRLSIEISNELLKNDLIKIAIHDCSNLSSMSNLSLAISKDTFAPSEKQQCAYYEGEEPESVDQTPLGVYQRRGLDIKFGVSYLTLNVFGNGMYRITTESFYNTCIGLFSIFVFEIKDGKILSIKEIIDGRSFDQYRFAYFYHNRDIRANKVMQMVKEQNISVG